MVSTSGNQKGGGYGSRQHTEVKIRTGSGSKATRPAGTNMFGAAQGDHVTRKGESTGWKGERLHDPSKNFQPVKFGNEVALNVGGGGPGAGREVMRSGAQGTHGSVSPGNAPAKNKDILNEYGPNIRR
jgi:hypothetical protein